MIRKRALNNLMVVWLFASISLLASSAVGQSFKCAGQIGNGFGETNPEYRTFGNRTVKFVIQCNWFQQLKGQGDCSAAINGQGYSGAYLGEGAEKVFRLWGNDILSRGSFNVATEFLFFQISRGEEGSNQNYTQRWFNGFCEKD